MLPGGSSATRRSLRRPGKQAAALAEVGHRHEHTYEMASLVTHAFAAVAPTKTLSVDKRDCRSWALLVGTALLHDADVIGFAFGIEYGDLFGHRGLSHSV